MRRFEMVNEEHEKFWEVDVSDAEVLTRYGRLGTEGQQTIKSFGSTDEATKAADKLIASKVKKGYVEV